MDYLRDITFCFDKRFKSFSEKFVKFFDPVTVEENSTVYLKKSNEQFFPQVLFDLESDKEGISIDFDGDNYHKTVKVVNETGQNKESCEQYSEIDLEVVIERFNENDILVTRMDHVGFNLPWFEEGVHPEIAAIRNDLSPKCLYHKFPTGENWDFIIPGTTDEINRKIDVDYNLVRKPKIEIVSFDKCSKPLLQFDISCVDNSLKFEELFPEGIYDSNLDNVWIYVSNPFNVDFCIVLNRSRGGDWSSFFKEARI